MRSFRQIYSPFSTSVPPPLSTEPKLFNTILTQFLLTLTHANIKTSKWVSRFLAGQKVTGRFMCYCFFLAGCQSRKRLRLIDARPPREQALILARPWNYQGSVCSIWTFCQQKSRRVLWQMSVDVVWLLSSCLLIQLMKRKRVRWKQEMTPFGNEVNGLLQASTVTWKRVVDSKQKNRRC